jgi:hypothetical protein
MDFEKAVKESARVNRAVQTRFVVASLRDMCGLLAEGTVRLKLTLHAG